jgi:hypothetical protein
MKNYQVIVRDKLAFFQIMQQVRLRGFADIDTYYSLHHATNGFYMMPFKILRQSTKTMTAQDFFAVLENWKDTLSRIEKLSKHRETEESLLILKIFFKRKIVFIYRKIKQIFKNKP